MKFLRAMLPVALAATTLLSSGTALASSTDEAGFVTKINTARRASGLRALTAKSDLAAVARRHSADMAKAGTISHNKSLMSEVRGWREIGENVGMGPDVETLHEAFMSSSSHRANILGASYNEVGIGVAIADDGTMFVTEVFARREASKTIRRTASPARRTTPVAQPHHASPSRQTAAARQPKPASPAPPAPPARTVHMLVQMMGLDAN
ncbi:MAG: CAP domain-containing protein [Actinomycetota bacterium]